MHISLEARHEWLKIALRSAQVIWGSFFTLKAKKESKNSRSLTLYLTTPILIAVDFKMEPIPEEYMLKWNAHHNEICSELFDCCKVQLNYNLLYK